MNAKRLQLLGAFAAGCLATLAFAGSFWAEAEPSVTERARVRPVLPPHASAADLHPREREPIEPAEPAPVKTAEREQAAPPEAGSSVAEVLSRLEAAYREERAREEKEREQAIAAPDVTAPAATASAPLVALAHAAAALSAPVTVPEARVALPVAQNDAPLPVAQNDAPVLVARGDTPARVVTGDIHLGDSQRNVNVGSVHQGNAYALQQLALIQYIQFLTLSQYGAAAGPSPGARKAATRRPAPFATTLTNPDNPWGFDFPPTALVK